MKLPLETLLQSIGQAVQQAQTGMEIGAEQLYWQTWQQSDDPAGTCRPICRRLEIPMGPARTRCSRIFPGRPVSRPSSGICLREGFRCSRPIRKAGVSPAPGEPAPARGPEYPEPVRSRTGLRGVRSLGAGAGRTVFHRCGDPGPVLPL